MKINIIQNFTSMVTGHGNIRSYWHGNIRSYWHGNIRSYWHGNIRSYWQGNIRSYWHGNIRSYLHRLKIIEKPTCPCGTKDQTIDRLLFECELVNKERDSLISTVLKTDRRLANE
jgi:hypothetical protein